MLPWLVSISVKGLDQFRIGSIVPTTVISILLPTGRPWRSLEYKYHASACTNSNPFVLTTDSKLTTKALKLQEDLNRGYSKLFQNHISVCKYLIHTNHNLGRSKTNYLPLQYLTMQTDTTVSSPYHLEKHDVETSNTVPFPSKPSWAEMQAVSSHSQAKLLALSKLKAGVIWPGAF
jgi:hypothetical protein